MTDIATNFTDNIGMTVTSTYLNGLGTVVNELTHTRTQVDTYANLPAAATENTGTTYLCSDTDAVYHSNGTVWTKIRVAGQHTPNMADPPSSGLSYTTLGDSTFAADKDGRLLTAPTGGANWRIEHGALSPTSNYTATAYMDVAAIAGEGQNYGIVVMNASAGTFIHWGLSYVASWYGWNVAATKWTNSAAFNSLYLNRPINDMATTPHWFRIRDDATTRYYEWSFNGTDWTRHHSTTRTDFCTPDRVGWGASNGTVNTALMRLRSWSVA